MLRLALVLLLALALPAAAQSSRHLVALLDPAGIAKSCDEGLARARQMVGTLEAKAGGEGFLREWNGLQIEIEDARNPIAVLGGVHPEKAVRDAVEPCLQKYTTLNTEIYQNEKLYARLNAAKPGDSREEKLRRNIAEGFEDSGIALPPGKRARAKEIFTRLEQIRQAFDRTVREDPTRVVFTAKEMEGLPEAYLKARERDAQGNYVLTLADPSFWPFMENARDADARRRYYVAYNNQGGEGNLALLEEAFALRRELAELYGLPSFAHYALRRRMAGKPDAVDKFLAEVKAAVGNVEKRELDELAAAKARETGKAPGEVRLARWDTSYYLEKVRRERYSMDQEKLRKYFPSGKAVEFALLVAETLYAVKFREVRVPTWHPDVRYFDVLGPDGKYLAGLYVDIFPREGKQRGAYAASVRRASALEGRMPLSVLVANFDREGLNHQEFATLLHEYGHGLHNVLSRARYVSQAGTSVKRDFVEAPSQMFEEWVRREQPLALFAKVCPECPRLTRDEISRLDEARKFGRGVHYSRQRLYAQFDMALSMQPQPPLALWKKMEADTLLGHVDGTRFPASFAHLVGGYAAGYYGYLWSEVLALDMLSPFEKDMLDPKLGARYLDTILSVGGEDEEANLVRKFLGRDPSSDAFFAEITGKR